MDPIKRLLKLMEWQDANRPLKVEEKAKLMKLPDNEFEDKLHQMALDFKNDGVIRVSLKQLKFTVLSLTTLFLLFAGATMKIMYEQEQHIKDLENAVQMNFESTGHWAESIEKIKETNKAQDVMINKFNRELFPQKETKEVEENDNN
ncbi:hypothetical protein [Streptococcus parasanguinis]|uniref:hypothetical protein n=2 Tax=Streptococcus parasanguinis TaxID=1318 RepID=UPI001899BFEF|nr:hypothetical protein [Streptococcus parasanguinis]